MKTYYLPLKFFSLLFLLSLLFTSCGDVKESNKTDEKAEKNTQETKVENTEEDNLKTTSKNNEFRLAESNDSSSPDNPEGNTAPIALDCNYFSKNPNTILKDNPAAKVDYIIPCMTRIDGKLSIEAGVVIAFEQDAGLDFKNKSSFTMLGTAQKPIILTGKEQTKGFWRGIYTVSPNGNNKMRHVTVEYAGGSKAALEINRDKTSLSLENCSFSNSKNIGMLLNDAVGKDVRNIVMKNCSFTKNKIPVKTNITRLRIFNGSNTFSGNEKDYISLEYEKLYGDATWVKLDVPYLLQDNFRYRDGVLTIEPGTEIIISAQNWMHLSKKASLIMTGTKEEPIIIRGEHDVPGFWIGLTINSSSPLNEIAHVNFKNAGSTTGNPNGVVRLKSSKFLKIHDVVFTNCFEYAISLQSASRSHLEHSNLKLENTPKLFSDWNGEEIADPNNL